MVTGAELDRLIDWWLAQGTANRGTAELMSHQEQVLQALAQGTAWAGGRLPLSFQLSPYEVQVRESHFFASSALDCLCLPALLGGSVTVTTTCPSNGERIHMVVTSQGVRQCEPQGSVLAVVVPGVAMGQPAEGEEGTSYGVQRMAHFFSSAEAAALWSVAYPEVTILDIDQAWRLANGVLTAEVVEQDKR